jgi:hypothetical protein
VRALEISARGRETDETTLRNFDPYIGSSAPHRIPHLGASETTGGRHAQHVCWRNVRIQ